MKRVLKISSILLLLIVACCPLLLFSGCTTDGSTDAKVVFEPLTGWTFTVGDELKDGVVTGFKATGVETKYNESTGKYESKLSSTSYTTVKDACEKGGLRGYVDTATATADGKTRSAVVTFSGASFTITYTVTAKA